jgi:aldose sugar dehydrogenase
MPTLLHVALRTAVLALALLLAPLAVPSHAQASLEPVVEGFDFATNVAVAPDGRLFVTEKDEGKIAIVRDGEIMPEPFAQLPVIDGGETGLLGIALDPDFPRAPWVYAYYSDANDGMNKVVRIRADGDRGTDVQTLLATVPATNGYHNGGDLAFGQDGMLYVSVGEAHESERAQDPNDLGGKILRLEPDGSVPPDDPLGPDSPVFAMGIRNSFGLCVDPVTGDLWETENGPDRFDEVNRIEAGRNYGWPDQLGPGGEPRFADPILAYETVIVPTGCAVSGDGSALLFGTYGGELHRVALPVDDPPRDEVVARLPAGITDVARAPDGTILVVTTDAIYRLADGTTAASATPRSSTAAPTPTASPTPGAGGSGGLSVGGIIVGVVLVGLLLFMRSRLERSGPPEGS